MCALILNAVRSIRHPFASHLNFLDPQWTNDGKPYGPVRFKEIVKERYLISKHTNTSYGDTGKITPTEKSYLLEFINNDLKRAQEMLKDADQNAKKYHPPKPKTKR